MSRFFIHRPIFAIVISMIIVIAGWITLRGLPVAMFPEIAPPTIEVRAVYPGASASVVANTVAQPIEEQVNGVEDMLYMSSNSANDGTYSLMITFKVGTDLDQALVQVQNRVAQANGQLPEEVQRIGLVTNKVSTNVLLFASLIADNGDYDELFLGNYATLRVKDELTRIDGVGNIIIFGASDYSMRIWLDPDKLKARNLTTSDVIGAIREQNVQVAAGQIGQSPGPQGQVFQLALSAQGRLTEVEEFEQIVLRNLPGNRVIRVKDVARVELGAETYDVSSQLNGKASAAIGVFLEPGANALSVSERVFERMDELAQSFPAGISYQIPFDITEFVSTSIREVVNTLMIAMGLVFLTTFIFLQDWRATLIPSLTIPVSLIGTFAVMGFLGVSINMLSLFGLVLAIGVVVDDAIVVVENTVRIMDDEGLPRRQAAVKAMSQVTGPVIATSLVLLVVFVPTAFTGGITGSLFSQFAFTIATATVFSTINALTLSPALAGVLLRPTKTRNNIFSRAWKAVFSRGERWYRFTVGAAIKGKFVTLVVFGLLAYGAFYAFNRLPTGFLPTEDQGYLMLSVQLPDAASQERTMAVVEEINAMLEQVPGIQDYVSVPGFSLLDNAITSNSAAFWIILDPWAERLPKGQTAEMLLGQLWGIAGSVQDALVFAFAPPAIMGLGNAEGFQAQIQDISGEADLVEIQNAAWGLMGASQQRPELGQVFSTFRANVPQLGIDVNRDHVKALGTPLSDVYETLQANFGSVYVNDFNKFGRTYQVRVQGDARFRADPRNITDLRVRNRDGEMVPLGSFVKVSETVGPQLIPRYNMFASAALSGAPAPGYSSAEALAALEEEAAAILPPNLRLVWTGITYQEKMSEGQTGFIFLLAVLMVYLVLAAQYESWSLPLTVILSVPLSLLGTASAVIIRGMDVNVYTQIGIILLIALACKTAILISEFARAEREAGKSIIDAAVEAARLRFRPILMTAFTFILGVLPLVIAQGAGSAGRQALGTAVFGGMISATALLIVFVPVFYVVIQGGSERFLGFFRSSKGEQPAVSQT
ncbi:MAG: multidrug efflux RND transporter permease subunit [Acidobacteriota bacterium]|nr:multidrug efflux RND transporter permease subunit [Acidobacteriota bacterium]